MKYQLFIFIYFLNCVLLVAPQMSELKKYSYGQDIIVNKKIIIPGPDTLSCQRRYSLIKQALRAYKRPFLLIDLAPKAGFYTFGIAREFNSVCVMMDNNPSQSTFLKFLCTKNDDLKNLMYLESPATLENILHLGSTEHFDVVLALDMPDSEKNEWVNVLEAITHLGEAVIIEVPSQDSAKNDVVHKAIKNKGGISLGRINGKLKTTEMYLIKCKKESIRRCRWSDSCPSRPHEIISTSSHKVLKKNGRERVWYHGINFETFRAFNGIHPSPRLVFQRIEKTIPLAPRGATLIISGERIKILPPGKNSYAYP